MFVSMLRLAYNSFVVVVVLSLSGFGMGGILTSCNECGSVPSLSVSWKSLRNVGISFSLKVW
jgi:hypothetical protein